MTNYDAIEIAIDAASSTDGKLSISMAALDTEIPDYRTLSTTREVVASFKGMLSSFLNKYQKMHKNGDLRIVKYSPDFKPDSHHLEFIKVKGSHFESIINSVPEPSDTTVLDPEDIKFIDKLKFYVMIIKHENKRILVFKRYSKTKELGHRGGFLISWIGKQYGKVSDSVFSFDNQFDCLVVDGVLLSFNKKNTEIIFKYYDELRSSAFTTIDKIAQHIPIHNLEEFKHDCSTHLHKLGKLRNIAQKGYLPNLSIDKIRKIINKFHLSINIVVINGKEMLQHDPADKWALLNLLDDSYLSSALTGYDYEVNSKLILN